MIATILHSIERTLPIIPKGLRLAPCIKDIRDEAFDQESWHSRVLADTLLPIDNHSHRFLSHFLNRLTSLSGQVETLLPNPLIPNS